MLAGLEEVDAGTIFIGDRDVTDLPPKRRDVAMVFQNYALYPYLTVAANIAFPLRIAGVPKQERTRRTNEVAELLGLEQYLERKPGQLSGGQRQRVAMGRAIIRQPSVFLMDEPLSNLDAKLRVQMRAEIAALQSRLGTTTVYVTHDQSEAMTTSDLIAVMNLGKIEQLGSPEEIYDRPRSEFVARFIGSSNILKGKALDANHIEVAGVPLVVTGDPLKAGAATAISVRQHEIAMSSARGAANAIQATVIRHVFLGNSRDYMVELADGAQLRVVASAEQSLPQGGKVWLHLPPQRCRVLIG